MKRLALAAIGLALSAPAPALTTLWVAPNGNDASLGSADRPVATLARVRSLLGERMRNHAGDDVEIRMRGGVYSLAETVILSSRELGNGQQKVLFVAHAGERVIVTGSRRLEGEWRRVEGDLWALDVPAATAGRWVFRSLFRDEKSLPRAREPDQGFWTIKAVDAARQTISLREKLPEEYTRITGAQLNATAYWHFSRQPVAAITPDGITAARPIGTDVSSLRLSLKSHTRVWLENALAFADTPGEWFLDPGPGRLYYRAAPAENPNAAVFTAPVLRELIVIQGTAERWIGNVHFDRIEFAETDWELPADGRLGVQAGAWALDRSRTFSPGAALRFIHAVRTSVEGCVFRDLGDGAVAYEIGCHDGRIRACEFTRVGSNAIQVGRMPEYTGDRHPLHRDFATSRDWIDRQESFPSSLITWQRETQIPPDAPARFEIADNSIRDCGHLDFGSVAIWVGYASHVRIEHNLLQRLPYTGISVGWRWAPGLTNCHSNVIARNRIEDVMRQAGDGAGIYLVGEQPGTRVTENFVRGSGGNYWAHGLYADEWSNHMEFSGNYVVQVADHSIFMHKNGPSQIFRANNGETGPTAVKRVSATTTAADFTPARLPPDLALYGPRPVAQP